MSNGTLIVERDFVLQRVAEWWETRREPLFLLSGKPGAGKTIIARQVAEWASGRTGHGIFVHTTFCDARLDSTISPMHFVRSLAEFLSEHVPAYARELLGDPDDGVHFTGSAHADSAEEGSVVAGILIQELSIPTISAHAAFDRLIRLPLQRCLAQGGSMGPFLVVVDALDESLGYDSRGHLAELLAHVLRDAPAQLRFFATTRSDDERITSRLGEADLDLTAANDGRQDPDLVKFIDLGLSRSAIANAAELGKEIAKASEGNFLYAHYVLAELADAPYSGGAEGLELPNGLTGIYRQYLVREIAPDRVDHEWRKLYRPILGLIAVSRDAGISPHRIAQITGLAMSETHDVLRICGQFLIFDKNGDHVRSVRIYHGSFKTFLLTDERFNVFGAEAHAALARYLLDKKGSGWRPEADSYALANLPFHLRAAGMIEELRDAALDRSFLNAQSQGLRDSPDSPTNTFRLAIDLALEATNPAMAAELLVAGAIWHGTLLENSPLSALEGFTPPRALERVSMLNPDLRVLYELLICYDLVVLGDAHSASVILSQVAERDLGHLSDDDVDLAAVLLALLGVTAPQAVSKLAHKLLNDYGALISARCAIILHDYDYAASAANIGNDYIRRALAHFSIADDAVSRGQIDFARAHLLSIADAIAPEETGYKCEPMTEQQVARIGATARACVGDLAAASATLLSMRASESTLLAADEVLLYAYGAGPTNTDPAAHPDDLLARARAAVERIASRLAKGYAWFQIANAEYRLGMPEAAIEDLRAAVLAADQPLTADNSTRRFDDSANAYFAIASDSEHEESHDDPFHGPCRQGLTLRVACLAARLGYTTEALDFGSRLVEEGRDDGVTLLIDVIAAAHLASDTERAAEAASQASALLDRWHPPSWRVAKAVEAGLMLSDSDAQCEEFPSTPRQIVAAVDDVLRQMIQTTGFLPRMRSAVIRLFSSTGMFSEAFFVDFADSEEDLDTDDYEPDTQSIAENNSKDISVTNSEEHLDADNYELDMQSVAEEAFRNFSVTKAFRDAGLDEDGYRPDSERRGEPVKRFSTKWKSAMSAPQSTEGRPTEVTAYELSSRIQSAGAVHDGELVTTLKDRIRTQLAWERDVIRQAAAGSVMAFEDHMLYAKLLDSHAVVLARLGEHADARADAQQAEEQDQLATRSFLDTKFWMSLSYAVYAESADYERDTLAEHQVKRYCRLAEAAHGAGDNEAAKDYLDTAHHALPQDFARRAETAQVVARAAARCGLLASVPLAAEYSSALGILAKTEVMLDYCDAHRGSAPTPMPWEVLSIFTDLQADLSAASLACGGLAVLYPDRAVTIWEHIAEITAWPCAGLLTNSPATLSVISHNATGVHVRITMLDAETRYDCCNGQ